MKFRESRLYNFEKYMITILKYLIEQTSTPIFFMLNLDKKGRKYGQQHRKTENRLNFAILRTKFKVLYIANKEILLDESLI